MLSTDNIKGVNENELVSKHSVAKQQPLKTVFDRLDASRQAYGEIHSEGRLRQ